MTKTGTTIPALIAHRGYSSQYPENTIRAFREAFECGACYVECDVQLTKDRVPVLLHDNELSRTSGVPAKVQEINYTELQKLSAGFAEKFASQYKDEKIPSLEEFVGLLRQWPEAKAFVEIKRSSIREFGMEEVLQKVLPELEDIKAQVIVISFDDEVIRRLIDEGEWKTGWVIEQWSDTILIKAENLAPDYLFVDADCLPSGLEQFYESNWHWVVYEVDDPVLASQWIQRGAEFVETNDIKQMLKAEVFSRSGCTE